MYFDETKNKTIFSVTEAPSRPPVPVDPCQSEPCGAFSECRNQGGVAVCSCLPGYTGEPPSCAQRGNVHGKISTLYCLGDRG